MQTGDTIIDYDPHVETVYVRASTGKRFANYIIDMIAFYLVAFAIIMFIAVSSPTSIEDMVDDNAGSQLIDRILFIVGYALFMSIVAALFKGKSLGKLITGTQAVNLDGSSISVGTAFGRGFSRAVPFCAFSAFGNPSNPWQDRWTDTMVIDQKLSRIAH